MTVDFSNPISEKKEKLYKTLPNEIVARVEAVSKEPAKQYQLIPFRKKKKVNNQKGDIFVVQPVAGLFYWGQILSTNISTLDKNSFIDGKNLIVIFNISTNSSELPSENLPFDYYDLLITPTIVDDVYWSRGLFLSMGNIPAPSVEQLDYGFWSYSPRGFFTAEGVPIEHTPRMMGIRGITTITGVAAEIKRELIIRGII